MDAASGTALAGALFDRFAKAFATFDAANIAKLFAVPALAFGQDSSIAVLTRPEDVLRHYQAALDAYHQNGCRTCRWTMLEVTPMGSAALLASVTWQLLHDDQSIVLSWRQSYTISTLADDSKIFAAITHAP